MAENRPQIMLSVKDANRLEALLESLSDDVVTKKSLIVRLLSMMRCYRMKS
ncbi:TPA: hypothetical protein ACX6RM_001765 [Photobacterium damselae]